MGPLQKLRYKTRIGLLLGVLLAALVINNVAGRYSIDKLERTAQSMYDDRLMPSTFIFELREHLDAQQALMFAGDKSALRQELNKHRAAIGELIRRYELTVLTSEEQREWNRLKWHLYQLSMGNEATAAHFTESHKALNHLSLIQAGEGKRLEDQMQAVVNASATRSYLEIALIIGIGIVTLSLIGYSRNVFEQQVTHRPSLN